MNICGIVFKYDGNNVEVYFCIGELAAGRMQVFESRFHKVLLLGRGYVYQRVGGDWRLPALHLHKMQAVPVSGYQVYLAVPSAPVALQHRLPFAGEPESGSIFSFLPKLLISVSLAASDESIILYYRFQCCGSRSAARKFNTEVKQGRLAFIDDPQLVPVG